jgi:hypothetical protein
MRRKSSRRLVVTRRFDTIRVLDSRQPRREPSPVEIKILADAFEAKMEIPA